MIDVLMKDRQYVGHVTTGTSDPLPCDFHSKVHNLKTDYIRSLRYISS